MSDKRKVGYKRPPLHTRFKPGQSGNPRGRPKDRKNVAQLLRETLYRPVTVKLNGASRRMPAIEAVVHTLAHRALSGDARARRDLFALLARYPSAVAAKRVVPTIESTMTPKEAAKAYEALLREYSDVPEEDDDDDELV